MNGFRRFMAGRYGVDQLSMVLLVCSFILSLFATLLEIPLLTAIGYLPLGFSLSRMLSRDLQKRSLENYRFAMFISPAYAWLLRVLRRLRDARTHRYFQCHCCKMRLRVPKGKGKMIITCPRCSSRFTGRT